MMFSEIIRSAQKAWNTSWYSFIFYNTNLSKVLANQNASLADIVNAYRSSWSITRWFFRFSMSVTGSKTFENTLEALLTLKQTDSENPVIFQAVLDHENPQELINTLNKLNQAYDKILVCKYQNPGVEMEHLLQAFNKLLKAGILKEYQTMVFEYPDQPLDIANAIVMLHKSDLLSKEIIQKLSGFPSFRIDKLAENLVELKKRKLLTDEAIAIDIILNVGSNFSFLEQMKKEMLESHPDKADELFRLFCEKFAKKEFLDLKDSETIIANLSKELSTDSPASPSSSSEEGSYFPSFFALSSEYNAEVEGVVTRLGI